MEASQPSGVRQCEQFLGAFARHPVEVGQEFVAELHTVYVNAEAAPLFTAFNPCPPYLRERHPAVPTIDARHEATAPGTATETELRPLVRSASVSPTGSDEGSVSSAVAAVRSLGIPDSALMVDVSGPMTTTSTWGDIHRPTFGGVKIEIWDGRYDYKSGTDTVFVLDGASNGYNVRLDGQPGQPTVMLTVAHFINEYAATNGYTGMGIYQIFCWTPSTPGLTCNFPVATVTTNPPWSTSGCPLSADFCTYADVAAATFRSGVSGTRGVGTSVTQGNDGNAGSSEINGVYAIGNVIDPTMVPIGRRNVFKSGSNTGTTAGTINLAFWNFVDSSLVWGNPKGSTYRRIVFQAQVRIDSIGFGYGDSGAPVFVRTATSGVCADYCALGLESSGGPNPVPTGPGARCDAGKNCHIGVSPWAAMQTQLGLGTLNPRTAP